MSLYKNWNILKNSKIGFEFEFFSNKSASIIKKDIEKMLNISITNKKGEFRLIKDLSGGMYMFEFITPPKTFLESLVILDKMFKYIRDNGYTTIKSAFQFSFSFDKDLDQVSSLNVLKCMLGYDENVVYNKFKDRKYSVYAKSIKQFKPINNIININDVTDNNFETPSSKYYGINFEHLKQNYLEIRYCGGSGYENKYDDVREIIEYTISKIYVMLQNPQLNLDERNELKRIVTLNSNKIATLKTYDTFLQHYKGKIKLTIDLAPNYDILRYRFESLRTHLFNLIVLNDIKTCEVNLDTDRMKVQLKKLSNTDVDLKDFEIFDSKISGQFEKCSFFDCDINYSDFLDCMIVNKNNVRNSKLDACYIGHSNSLYQCFVKSHSNQLVSGHYKKSIITGGNISKFLTADKETEILGNKYHKYKVDLTDKQ